MNYDEQRKQISDFLHYQPVERSVDFVIHETIQENSYSRLRISYPSNEGDTIYAFLLVPEGAGQFPALLIQHQHAGQRHLGKSEVCGLAGDPLQAFGSLFAELGFVVLAPDSICFEDRRRNQMGIEERESDGMQHFNEMCYRLCQGDFLMRKVLDDAALGLLLLEQHSQVDSKRIGTLGHSYGGNNVLFHAAVDERIAFVCSSGAVCSYEYKLAHEIGLEMALVIPGFAAKWDFQHLIQCIAPRPLLIVSADDDPVSQDAEAVVAKVVSAYSGTNMLTHLRYEGKHAMTQERFDAIREWILEQVNS